MSLFTKIRTGETFLEEVPASLGQALGVAAEEALLFSPTSSAHRLQQLRAARVGDPVSLGGGEFGIDEAPVMRETSRLLSAEQARARVSEAGVTLDVPETGIREEALGLLIERKRDEMRRQDILSRAPAGPGAMAARFGVAIAASVLDPLNVAASFVPLVGPTRYAAMLARARTAAQRAGVRAQVGAVEGAAGAALVEPIVLGAAITEQADYDAADSLLNMALGTGLGAGLHTGGGAIADAVAKGRPWQTARPDGELPRILDEAPVEVRESALRTAVAQAATGRNIDVEPVLRVAGAGEGRFGAPEMRAPTRSEQIETVRDPSAIDTEGSIASLRAQTADRLAPEELTTLDRAFNRFERPEGFDALRRKATAEVEQPMVVYRGLVGDRTVLDRRSFLPTSSRPEVAETFGTPVPRAEGRQRAAIAEIHVHPGVRAFVPDSGIGHEVVLAPGTVYDVVSRRMDEAPNGEPVERLTVIARPGGQPAAPLGGGQALGELTAQARASFQPENVRLADFEASRLADEELRTAPADEEMPDVTLEEAMQDVTDLARALGDEELPGRELATFDELDGTARAYGQAVRAAANCGLRRGGS